MAHNIPDHTNIIYLCQYFNDKKTIKSTGAHPHQIVAIICTLCDLKSTRLVILMHGSPQFLKHFLIFCCYNEDPVHQACLIHIHLLHLPWTLILDQLFRQLVFIAMLWLFWVSWYISLLFVVLSDAKSVIQIHQMTLWSAINFETLDSFHDLIKEITQATEPSQIWI